LFELSRIEISKISKGYSLEKYNEYIDKVLDKTLEVLQIPDKQKREIRAPRISDDENGKEEILVATSIDSGFLSTTGIIKCKAVPIPISIARETNVFVFIVE